MMELTHKVNFLHYLFIFANVTVVALVIGTCYHYQGTSEPVRYKVVPLNLNANYETNKELEDPLNVLLSKSVRILCVVQTTGHRHQQRAYIIKNTWARRCSRIIFASDLEDVKLPSGNFSKPGREYVSFKLRGAYTYIYDSFFGQFDWVVKADDDTFVVMENLRRFLADYNPNKDYYFGHQYKFYESDKNITEYTAGMASVFSRSAFKKMVTEAFPKNNSECPLPGKGRHEDLDTGRCLASVGVRMGDSRDMLGRERFIVFAVWHSLRGASRSPDWIYNLNKYPYTEDKECCSDSAIAYHYVAEEYMITIEYLLYRVNIFGSKTCSESRSLPIYRQKLLSNEYEVLPDSLF